MNLRTPQDFTSKTCPKCDGAGWFFKDGKRYLCGCQRAEERVIRRKYSNLPEFTHYPLLPVTQRFINDYDTIKKSGRNWIMYTGKSGSGKSTQAYMIVDTLLNSSKPVYAKCFLYQDLIHELTAFRFDYDRFYDSLDNILDAELILLDDFIDVIPRPESFEEQVVLTIIKKRYNQRKPLILTSELTPQMFRNLFPRHGEALLGRIVEMCDSRIDIARADKPNYRLGALHN